MRSAAERIAVCPPPVSGGSAQSIAKVGQMWPTMDAKKAPSEYETRELREYDTPCWMMPGTSQYNRQMVVTMMMALEWSSSLQTA